MDPATFANTIMQLLTPLLPYLSTAGTAIATSAGNAVYDKSAEQGKHLLDSIKTRFAKEKDGGSATQALQTFADGDLDYSIVVKTKLERLLRDDADFAENLLRIIQSGPLQSLVVGDEAIARNIGMSNNLGAGTQKIQTGKGSETTDIRMNMNTGDVP
ncbi:MAG: hypothetical protein NVS4B7_01510 [Ktedonobacteraceae bacterium]